MYLSFEIFIFKLRVSKKLLPVQWSEFVWWRHQWNPGWTEVLECRLGSFYYYPVNSMQILYGFILRALIHTVVCSFTTFLNVNSLLVQVSGHQINNNNDLVCEDKGTKVMVIKDKMWFSFCDRRVTKPVNKTCITLHTLSVVLLI